jgi:hypothetical protein
MLAIANSDHGRSDDDDDQDLQKPVFDTRSDDAGDSLGELSHALDNVRSGEAS